MNLPLFFSPDNLAFLLRDWHIARLFESIHYLFIMAGLISLSNLRKDNFGSD